MMCRYGRNAYCPMTIKALFSHLHHDFLTVIVNRPYRLKCTGITKTGSASKQYAASYLGCIDDAVLDGPADIPVYRPHLMTGGKYTPYFSVNDTVYVKFAQIDRASFRFWNEYIKSQSLANNMFLSTSSNLPSNITGGLGYWCGYGSAEGMFIIRNYAGE